jgi:hypothetical protein
MGGKDIPMSRELRLVAEVGGRIRRSACPEAFAARLSLTLGVRPPVRVLVVQK